MPACIAKCQHFFQSESHGLQTTPRGPLSHHDAKAHIIQSNNIRHINHISQHGCKMNRARKSLIFILSGAISGCGTYYYNSSHPYFTKIALEVPENQLATIVGQPIQYNLTTPNHSTIFACINGERISSPKGYHEVKIPAGRTYLEIVGQKGMATYNAFLTFDASPGESYVVVNGPDPIWYNRYPIYIYQSDDRVNLAINTPKDAPKDVACLPQWWRFMPYSG